jgi:hypothetical protein
MPSNRLMLNQETLWQLTNNSDTNDPEQRGIPTMSWLNCTGGTSMSICLDKKPF